jgi:hypothetical protein
MDLEKTARKSLRDTELGTFVCSGRLREAKRAGERYGIGLAPPERQFERAQRLRRSIPGKEQLPEKLAHRPEPVLDGHVLLSAIL